MIDALILTLLISDAVRWLVMFICNCRFFPGDRLFTISPGAIATKEPLSMDLWMLPRERASTMFKRKDSELFKVPSEAVMVIALMPRSEEFGVNEINPVFVSISNKEVLSDNVTLSPSTSDALMVKD